MENNSLDGQDYVKTSNNLRWKSGRRVDPRLLTLLELFGEIYTERHEFFKKIFHENHEELFEKIGHAVKRKKMMKKAKSMPRSLSMRAMGQHRGIDDEENDELKLERFKVRTPNVVVVGEDGVGTTGSEGQTQSTQGSNGSK